MGPNGTGTLMNGHHHCEIGLLFPPKGSVIMIK